MDWTDDGDSEFDYGAIKLNGSPGINTGWLGYRTSNVDVSKGITRSSSGYHVIYTMWTDLWTIEGLSRIFSI